MSELNGEVKIALKNKILSLKEEFLSTIDYDKYDKNNENENYNGEILEENGNEMINKKSKILKDVKLKKSNTNKNKNDNRDENGDGINDDKKRIFLTAPVALKICSEISALALGECCTIFILFFSSLLSFTFLLSYF